MSTPGRALRPSPALIVGILMMLGGITWFVNTTQVRDQEGAYQESLYAQRLQFRVCTQTKASVTRPECQQPVAPPPKEVEPGNETEAPVPDPSPSPLPPEVRRETRIIQQVVPDERIEAKVEQFFAVNGAALTSLLGDDVEREVAVYLTKNPPQRGRPGRDAKPPTRKEIQDAVAVVIAADPPQDGAPGVAGAAGVGFETAISDGCDLVLTKTDGSTVRVGPLCGPQGPQGIQGEPGPQGPPPACAPDCKGPQGPAGVDAPRIVNIACETTFPGELTQTYTFDNGQTIEVTCASAPPEPGSPQEP